MKIDIGEGAVRFVEALAAAAEVFSELKNDDDVPAVFDPMLTNWRASVLTLQEIIADAYNQERRKS